MSEKYLIFGATGSIGSNLAKLMVGKKQNVQLIGRDENGLNALSSELGCKYSVVDVLDEQSVKNLKNEFEGQEIVVGIRPEAFEDSVYANDKEFSEQVSIEITLLEQLGSDTYVHFYKDIKPVQTKAIEEILADEGEDISVLGTQTKFIARINPNSTVEEGQKINLALDPTKLHYFDPESGLAIR